jgi:quercetin dioxygenase-like cupin family protein
MNVLQPRDAALAAHAVSLTRPASAVIADTPDARLVVFRLQPGQAVPTHRNASTVLLTVLEGSGVLTGEENGEACEGECGPGTVVLYAPNEPHGMRATDTELLLLATITPRPGDRRTEG